MINNILGIKDIDDINDMFREYINVFDFLISVDMADEVLNKTRIQLQEYKVKDLSYNLIVHTMLSNMKNFILKTYPSIKSDDITFINNGKYGLYLNNVDMIHIKDFKMAYFLYGMKDKSFTQKYNEFINYNYSVDTDDINDDISDVLADIDIRYCTTDKLLDFVIDTLSKNKKKIDVDLFKNNLYNICKNTYIEIDGQNQITEILNLEYLNIDIIKNFYKSLQNIIHNLYRHIPIKNIIYDLDNYDIYILDKNKNKISLSSSKQIKFRLFYFLNYIADNKVELLSSLVSEDYISNILFNSLNLNNPKKELNYFILNELKKNITDIISNHDKTWGEKH